MRRHSFLEYLLYVTSHLNCKCVFLNLGENHRRIDQVLGEFWRFVLPYLADDIQEPRVICGLWSKKDAVRLQLPYTTGIQVIALTNW